MPASPFIRVLLPIFNMGKSRELVTLFSHHFQEYQRWRIDVVHTLTPPDEFREMQRRWPADGIIAFPVSAYRGGALHDLGVPTLAVFCDDGPLPVVRQDDVEVGRRAARHLVTPGWSAHAAFDVDAPWWRDRLAGWQAEAPNSTVTMIGALSREEAIAWLRDLPRRSAIFAACDATAFTILRNATLAERTFGTDLRLIGVDDDPECLLSTPTLSSVRQPIHDIARNAVRTMHRMLEGQEVPQLQTLPPEALVVRQSSDPFCRQEAWIRELAEEIRLTVASGQRPHLQTMVARLGKSTSTVYRVWQRVTGDSLMSFIQQVRAEVGVKTRQRHKS